MGWGAGSLSESALFAAWVSRRLVQEDQLGTAGHGSRIYSPEPTEKSQAWWCWLVLPVLGRQRQAFPWGLQASLSHLLGEFQASERACLEKHIAGVWGMVLKVALWPPHAHNVYKNLYTHTHIKKKIHFMSTNFGHLWRLLYHVYKFQRYWVLVTGCLNTIVFPFS